MNTAPPPLRDPQEPPVTLPAWARAQRSQTPEETIFAAGAALSVLHLALQRPDLPQALLRDRLALAAAEACTVLAGRPERASDLRDALHLLRPGDHPGPAGEVHMAWHEALARPLSPKALAGALPDCSEAEIAGWLAAPSHGLTPPARAAEVIETVLATRPRAEAAALILAEAALAEALGWRHAVPVLASELSARDLRRTGADLRHACHLAAVAGADTALRLAADLTRRATRLADVAPRLRAKGAQPAVDLFLSRDAVSPAVLRAYLSDRAARRLCDRLVSLGVVRELTGRDSFRLYGL